MFVAMNIILSRQAYSCRDKHVFCHDKRRLVATKLLSRQNYVCREKYLSKIYLGRLNNRGRGMYEVNGLELCEGVPGIVVG